MRAASARICSTRSEDSPSFSGPSLVVDISAITSASEPDLRSKRRRSPPDVLKSKAACSSNALSRRPNTPTRTIFLADRSVKRASRRSPTLRIAGPDLAGHVRRHEIKESADLAGQIIGLQEDRIDAFVK